MDVFPNSRRCHRSRADIVRIRQILIELQCVPAGLTETSFDTLCNEIECVDVNKSVLYLQNDVSECVYFVWTGSISFYFEHDPYVQCYIQLQSARIKESDYSSIDPNVLGCFVGECEVCDTFWNVDYMEYL